MKINTLAMALGGVFTLAAVQYSSQAGQDEPEPNNEATPVAINAEVTAKDFANAAEANDNSQEPRKLTLENLRVTHDEMNQLIEDLQDASLTKSEKLKRYLAFNDVWTPLMKQNREFDQNAENAGLFKVVSRSSEPLTVADLGAELPPATSDYDFETAQFEEANAVLTDAQSTKTDKEQAYQHLQREVQIAMKRAVLMNELADKADIWAAPLTDAEINQFDTISVKVKETSNAPLPPKTKLGL